MHKTIYVLLFLLTIVTIPLGYLNYECTAEVTKSVDEYNNFWTVFTTITVNNIVFVLLLILSGISYNIITAGMLLYNGFTWGGQIAIIVCNYGAAFMLNNLVFHFGFELLWIFVAIVLSVRLRKALFGLFNDKITSQEFIEKSKSMLRLFIINILLVVFTAFIEAYFPTLKLIG